MSDQPNNHKHIAGEDAYGQILDHAYDGIQEYDNPLPAWWSWLYILSIVFALLYMAITLAANGALSPAGFFERAKIADLQKRFGALGELAPDDGTILAYAVNDEWLPAGQAVFQNKCATCHGASAEGKTGPNLTDAFWIHVQTPKDIADVVAKGRNGNAMPAQEALLHPNEIVLVSSYLVSRQGQNASGLPPQGKEIAPWPLPAPAPAPGSGSGNSEAPGSSQ